MACGWLEVLWIMIWIRFSIFWIRFKRPHLKTNSISPASTPKKLGIGHGFEVPLKFWTRGEWHSAVVVTSGDKADNRPGP